ncbi:uncharacterized protein LOC133663306 isoform X2 [Entelurus aequoreus]|uniref:uncharacterized protein LOC133663306 isoform X2 n=1 Tax=Entelurus aequoreus TaxID=161455 RepID=UPI002B1E230C|nr:uncharacterized protein LOC133663306 isoform X2 [Entelurus aequoreus]XP_061923668.1 uncharacterized protein LOC133663306 isoform X2 [Entelurus aequoreus]
MIAEYEEEISRIKEENERLLDAVFKTRIESNRSDASEDNVPPEQQKWSFRMEQEWPEPPHIKEEEEDHSITQEGEHLKGLEEFPVIHDLVKSEIDEDKDQSKDPSSSSTQHMASEADGDHFGASQADNLLAPLSDSDDTTSHSADTDDDDDSADKTCHTSNTHFECSHCDKTYEEQKQINSVLLFEIRNGC